jgi:hypothetical protein
LLGLVSGRCELAALWIAMLFLFAYGDIFGFFSPGQHQEPSGSTPRSWLCPATSDRIWPALTASVHRPPPSTGRPPPDWNAQL